MKRNRGSVPVWLMCLLLPLWLQAQAPYAWSAVQSKRTAAVHEAVVVEYTCRFNSEAYEYIIVFTPPPETEAYRMVVEGTREQIVSGKRVNTYRYVVFPKKAGTLTLAFDASMERTTKASIENTVIGRDNVQKIDYTAQNVSLPPVTVAVAPQGTPYAGQMRLHVDVDKTEADPYVPVQVRIRLEGYGNLDVFKPFTLNIPDARVFTDGPEPKLRLGDNGYEGTIVQQFAVVADRNFTVPALRLRYFDPERDAVTTVESKAYTVTIRPAASGEQASVPSAEPHTDTGSSTEHWLQLLLALAAGIAVGRFLLPVSAEESGKFPLSKRLLRCRDPQQFAVYLAMLDAQKYREIIDEIEGRLKRGEAADLKRYKRLIA